MSMGSIKTTSKECFDRVTCKKDEWQWLKSDSKRYERDEIRKEGPFNWLMVIMILQQVYHLLLWRIQGFCCLIGPRNFINSYYLEKTILGMCLL